MSLGKTQQGSRGENRSTNPRRILCFASEIKRSYTALQLWVREFSGQGYFILRRAVEHVDVSTIGFA